MREGAQCRLALGAQPFQPPTLLHDNRPMAVPGNPSRVDGPGKDRRGQGTGKVLAALGPVETVPQQGPPAVRQLNPKLGKHRTPGRRDGQTVPIGQQPGAKHPVAQGHPEPPGKVVITGTGGSEPPSPNTGPQPPRRLVPTMKSKTLDQLGDLNPDKPHIPMPPLLDRTYEPAIDKNTHMLTGSRRRDPCGLGQLPDSPGPPIDERKTHGGPTVISQHSGDLGNLHNQRLSGEHVDDDRYMGLLR